MDWEKGEESSNLEDRRQMTPTRLAIGGGIGTLLIVVVGYFLGVDPQKLNQLVGNAGNGNQVGANGQAEERPPTPEEERSRKFNATILRFTEQVWEDQC